MRGGGSCVIKNVTENCYAVIIIAMVPVVYAIRTQAYLRYHCYHIKVK